MAAQGHSMDIQLRCVKTFGQPSSSADSQQTQDSPRVNASAAGLHHGSPDVLCRECSVGHLDGHSARWQQHGGAHQQAARFPSEEAFAVPYSAVAASSPALSYGPEDPASAKEAFKQLTSHMSPAALTELQNTIREQRLHRQQQDTFALIAAGAPAAPSLGLPAGSWTPTLPCLNRTPFAGLVHQGLYSLDGMRIFGEAAAAFSAALNQHQSCTQHSAHYSSYLPGIASQQETLSQQCPRQQYHCSPVMSAATAAAAAPAAAAASCYQHPGIASCRAPRSKRTRKPRTAAVCTLSLDDSNPQLQPVLAAAAEIAVAVPEAAASPPFEISIPSPSPPPPPAEAAADDCPSMSDNPSSSSSLKARFSRLSSDVQAALLSQLDDLEASEVQRKTAQEARRTAREPAAGKAPRKSSRTRKAKMVEDEDQLLPANNSRSVSPNPAAAAAAAEERGGSTDANSSTSIELHIPLPRQQQQHEVIKKRVRFAFADGDGGSESDDHAAGKKPRSSSSSVSPQIQGLGNSNDCDTLCALDGLTLFRLEAEGREGADDQAAVKRVVRRVGPRAQARKRMHKKTIRRRRPQRAPLC